MIDIENSNLSEDLLKQHVIECYCERDEAWYKEKGINILESMLEKVVKYRLSYEEETLRKLAKERKSFEFYSQLTLDDLCVLGY